MPSIADDQLTRLGFTVYENPGVYALLVGSGLSRSAGVPTGWEVTLDLIRRVGRAQGVSDQLDWAAWYREQTSEEPDYSKLVEALGGSPEERRSILHSYIEPNLEDQAEGRKVPTPAHHAIADLVQRGYIRVIITTNFDRLLENALRERGVEPTIVGSVDALKGAEPLTHAKCYVLKVHGDYKDARILNTDSELSGYPEEYDKLLDRVFDEHGLIVCGWSGTWDHALRAAILRCSSRRYSTFWAARGTPSLEANELIQHRAGRVLAISDADAFFTTLRDRVQVLEQTHRQNPQGIELLVASAKRYLVRPEHRIQLDELFIQEVEALTQKLDGSKFQSGHAWSIETFQERVAHYEAATEPLARMAGVLGRWGDGNELPLILDLLDAVCAHADRVGSGLMPWLGLRSYPAVLVWTAYGLGLTRAQRFGDLHRLFSHQLPKPSSAETERLIDRLFLDAWRGGQKDLWQNLEGFGRRKTPLSDHLHDLFSDWARSSVGIVADFTVLFETFEVLASLAYFERYSHEEAHEVSSIFNPRDPLFIPVGRVGWDHQTQAKVFRTLEAEKTPADLAAAGFSRGDPSFLVAAFGNLKRLASRL